ncbi:uncharacterized protein LOC117111951 [Anneissia japonica]|uniref:uncharacterized protein LOC117111951 n=1 Tax=Anneissia japonica TaxID=1529436 RepID=UPI001425AB15|nr:uncharacterized protein LOC117111951 [Anneissia japonica]
MDSTRFIVLLISVCCLYCASAQDRCCFPKRYRIDYDLDFIFIQADGFLGFHPTNLSITYDFIKPRALLRTGTFDVATGTTTYVNRLRNYNKKLEWVFGDNSPNCTIRELTAPDPLRCIPDNAEFLEDYHILEDIEVTDWEIQLNRSGILGEQQLSVTKEGCLPTSELFHLINYNTIPPSPVIQIGKFKNFEKLSQPRTNKELKVPKTCPKDIAKNPTLQRRSIDKQKGANILADMDTLNVMQPLSNW